MAKDELEVKMITIADGPTNGTIFVMEMQTQILYSN